MISDARTGMNEGAPQSAFGRTSSAEFQVQLSEQFHCLLKIDLPRFPFSSDSLSVWKRTSFVEGLNLDDSECEEESDDHPRKKKGRKAAKEEHAYSDALESGPGLWANIPLDEKVSEFSAPCLSHFLSCKTVSSTGSSSGMKTKK
jgi:hypothetical protein